MAKQRKTRGLRNQGINTRSASRNKDDTSEPSAFDATGHDMRERQRREASLDDPSYATFEQLKEYVRPFGYQMYEIIGAGSMGVVCRGHDSNLNRPVALKILRPNQSIKRFRKEARILASINSPYIVSVHSLVEPKNGYPILVMELLQGRDLGKIMKQLGGSISEVQAKVWMNETALGMAAAAAKGVCHRDLKPSNILIDDRNRAKVVDFGLATVETGISDPMTRSSDFLGTLAYMAPEQANDPHSVTTRADIYSFGATFYHALTGRPPFDSRSFVSMITSILHHEPTAPVELNPRLSERMNFLLQKCLAKSEQDRFQTFEEIIAYLNSQGDSLPPCSLWIYKCNAKSSAEGDWDYFFDEMDGYGGWGGTWCIKHHGSRKLIREEVQVGDLVLAWQTDKQAAVGLCRVVDLEDDGEDITIVLQVLLRFSTPVKLLEWKNRSPALANGKGFPRGKAGTIFETNPDEAAEILRICGVNLSTISGVNKSGRTFQGR